MNRLARWPVYPLAGCLFGLPINIFSERTNGQTGNGLNPIYIYGAIFIMRSCFCNPPGPLSFIWPLSKMKMNGTLMILYFDASTGLASTLSLPTRTFPFDSTPNWSIIGATAPQLGHQGAQAHISTGKGDFNIWLSKFASVTMIGWGANSSSVCNSSPHLPHLGPASSLLEGILFLAPH